MATESKFVQEGCRPDYTPVLALDAGQVIQLADGRAACTAEPVEAGRMGAVGTSGVFKLLKTASIALLAGGRVFWDHSANKAHYTTVNDRDFYVGTALEDAAGSDDTVLVLLNSQQRNTLDAINGPALIAPSGTAVVGSAGFGMPQVYGGSRGLLLTATSEVQKIDMLTVDRVATAANMIVEGQFRIGTNGSTSDVDFNIGIANGTHATDADSITNHLFLHVDGGALDILAQSKDGTTTVTATDTTVDATAGSAVANRFEFWMDCRNPADCQVYINGVLVLASTVFDISAATGPLGLLAHLEKATGTATAGPVYIDRLVARIMEQ